MNKIIVTTVFSTTLMASIASFSAITNYQGGAGSMGDIVVSATVAEACDISIGDLAFGTYDPNATGAKTQDATISYQCTTGTIPTLSFTTTTLEMAGPGSDVISYTLHQGAGGSGTSWTNGATYALPVSTGTAQTSTYSGNAPINQFVQAGNYNQNLTITLGF